MIESLVPSKKQWDSWSLPSKLTALGFLFSVIVPAVLAIVIFIVSRSSSDFVAEYKDMDFVPLAAIQKGFGLFNRNLIENDSQIRLLRVSVKNAKSIEAQNVTLVVADYIQKLNFVLEENGDAIQKYTLTPSGNTSRLTVPLGDLPPHNEHVIFIGGTCLFIDFADIHAESSNLGMSESSQMGELSGARLFMGMYAEWITIIFLLLLSAALFAATKKKA